MAGQESSVQELGLLHDDPAARANDARELAQRPVRLLDVVEDVAAPDPVERRVGRVELGGVTLAKFETRGGSAVADKRAGRLRPFRRRLDAHHAPPWPDRLGQPEAKSPTPQPTSRPREPSGKWRSVMRARASGSWKRFMRSSDFVKGSVSG